MSDRILGLFGVALGLVYIWSATLIQESFMSDPIGPKAFPYIIGVAMLLASAVFVVRPDPEPDWPRAGRLLEIGFAAIVMIAYAWSLPLAGFVVATAVASCLLAWRLGARPLGAVIAGIAIAVGIYVCFHLILGLSLARGPWGF